MPYRLVASVRAATLVVVGVVGAMAALAATPIVLAQAGPPSQPVPVTFPLWDGRTPGALGHAPEDIPTLTAYLPRGGRHPLTAIVLAPGGGYTHLSMDKEGKQVAYYLNTYGVAVFVLKYRLGPRYHHPIELGDMQRAIRLIRARAVEWDVARDRVGVMGFSAGGHLASTASTHFDAGDANATDPIARESSRPDFAILAYPVISMTEPWTHQGSKTALLGTNPSPALATSLSTDTQVTPTTPPTFLFHTASDTSVPVENSLTYFAALRKAGVPAELHVFKQGSHGVGLAQDNPELASWPGLLASWLRGNGLIP